jgi:cytochrome c peroxidase
VAFDDRTFMSSFPWMRKIIFISVLIFLVTGIAVLSCRQKLSTPEKTIEKNLLSQVDSFTRICFQMKGITDSSKADEPLLQNLFLQARLGYKKFEWAAEYFVPATSRMVNGPPVQEIEMPDVQVLDPSGLQVIENFLFPHYDTSRKKELVAQLNLLILNCQKYNTYFGNIDFFDWQVFDAAKLEVFRIMTLGITGFDNPLTLKSMPESATALTSIREVMGFYPGQSASDGLRTKLEVAIRYLQDHPEFNSFDRMEFIRHYCNPVTTAITDREKELKIHIIIYNRLLNQDARTLFDTNTFNINAFAPDHSSFISAAKIALGKKLFSDPDLSGNGTRSCQSCHQPGNAFTDGLVKNTIIGQKGTLERNTPTLINAALQPSLFYDLRVNSLEEQSHTVVQSDKEMHGSMQVSVKKLWKDSIYRRMFQSAFPYEEKDHIDTFQVMNAIGSYIRSLVYLNSRFDEYMRGNNLAMQSDEISGFNLFMGKAKCATCHYLPLFNGTFPPAFKKIEVEVIGVPKSRTLHEIDPDPGRYSIVKVASVKYAFKISTVRNSSLTAPYMHNGVFTSLDQVLDFYNKGGGWGLGIKLENQTLPAEKLNLSDKEVQDIIAFIKSLDSKIPLN